MRRVLCLLDQDDWVGGGERMMLRVAAVARRFAPTDLGILWGHGGALASAELSGFDAIARFHFPEPIGWRTWRAHRAALRRLRVWAAGREPAAILTFSFRSAVRGAL